MEGVDVRIGVTDTPKELVVDLGDGDRDAVRADIEAALAGSAAVLWLTDKDGRTIGVPAQRIAYVEIGRPDGGRTIGFAADR